MTREVLLLVLYVSTISVVIGQNDLFSQQSRKNLEDRMTSLREKSQNIIAEYRNNGRKVDTQLRNRVIDFFLEFMYLEREVEWYKSEEMNEVAAAIIRRFEEETGVKYHRVKTKIHRLVSRLFSPILSPFVMFTNTYDDPIRHSGIW